MYSDMLLFWRTVGKYPISDTALVYICTNRFFIFL